MSAFAPSALGLASARAVLLAPSVANGNATENVRGLSGARPSVAAPEPLPRRTWTDGEAEPDGPREGDGCPSVLVRPASWEDGWANESCRPLC